MPIASIDTDTAGGDIVASASKTQFNNQKVVLDGDSVAPHGISPHNAATVPANQNTSFYVENELVVVAGDTATCGHAATGSSTVTVG